MTMNRKQYQQVKKIFQSAIDLAPNERKALLDQVCTDTSQRLQVENLIDSFENQCLNDPGIKDLAGQKTLENLENQIFAGQRIGQYEILKKIGAGGMGEVFLAQDTKLLRQVAVKFLHPNSVSDVKAEKRMLREAQSVASVDHPNICTVHEIGEFFGRPFIVMQYVEGETLEERIKRKHLSISESIEIALCIADALEEAHSRGIVHRDIKPANIITNPRGQVKVLDFSLAKKILFQNDDSTQSLLSQAGAIAGTIAYMSPEQARGQEIDERSDIWSLGVVLYEMLTGRLPFEGETKSDIVVAILRNEPVPLKKYIENLPAETEHIFNKVFEKNRDRRYQTVQEFTRDLRNLLYWLDSETIIDNEAEIKERDLVVKPLKGRNTRPLPNAVTKESLGMKKQTDSDMSMVTDRNEIQNSAEHFPARILSPKFVLLGLVFLILSGFFIWRLTPSNSAKPVSFAAQSRSNLLISNLYNSKRKPGGNVSGLSFSPNGDLLVFTLSGNGKSSIYVKQLTGGEPVRLTDGKWMDNSPVWSPDGQRIAFLSDRNGTRGIWTVSYVGGTPVLLKEVDLPQGVILKKWSSDNNKIYYDFNYLLYSLNLTTGETAQITSDSKLTQIAISPNEEMIAYISVENEKDQIWVRPLQGGEPRRVVQSSSDIKFPVWFPDNQRLAYSFDQNGIYQISIADIQGGESSQITFSDTNSENVTVSPDGSKIAFLSVSDEANIYSYDLDTKKETAQTENTGLQIFPDISTDGEHLSYQSMRLLTKVHTGSIKTKNLKDGGEPVTITENGGVAKWSPDGKKIAFIRSNGNEMNLLTVTANGQNEKQLTTEGIYTDGLSFAPVYTIGTYFSWSPDSSQIAYCLRKSDSINLWTINSDGSGEKMWTQNTDGRVRIDSPIWSPEGNRIAYITRIPPTNSAEKWQYGVSMAEAGQSVYLFQTEFQTKLLGWSEAGRDILIAVKSKNEVSLYTISLASGEQPKQIAKIPDANLLSFKLSNDGKNIAFTARRDDFDNVYMFSVERGESRQLTSNLDTTFYYSGLTWSPDGKSVYYAKQTGGLQISMITNQAVKELVYDR